MKIDHPNYQGECRRSNGKLKLAFRDWVWIFSTATVLLTSGAVAWTKVNGKVAVLEEKSAKVEQTPADIADIKKDVEYIKKEQIEAKEDFKEFRLEQKTINTKFVDKLDRILEAVK